MEHVQDTRVRWRARDGRETGEVTFEKWDAGSTQVHYQLEYEPAPWGVEEDGPAGLPAGARPRRSAGVQGARRVARSEGGARGAAWYSAGQPVV